MQGTTIPPESAVRQGLPLKEWKTFTPVLWAVVVSGTALTVILRGFDLRLLALPPIIIFGVLVTLATGSSWPLVLSILTTGVLATHYVLVRRRKQGGNYGEYLHEEMKYRHGAWEWKLPRRTGACLMFGLSRIGKHFYPVSSILATAAMGAAYMLIYLKNPEKGIETVMRVRFSVLNTLVMAQRLILLTLLWFIALTFLG